MRTRFRLLLCLLPVLLGAAGPAATDEGLRVLRITPAGLDVPAGRQIVIQFDRPVVALGAMSRSRVPVRIRPRLDCRWRWLDPGSLACELGPDEALQPATRYTLHIDPGLTALDGSGIEDTVEHTFVTQRPLVERVFFHRWLAPEVPVLQVRLNQPVTRASVQRHLFFEALGEGSGRMPVRVVAPHEDGEALLAGEATPAQLAHAALLASQPRRDWMLAPDEPLPADARVGLNVEPGLVGAGPLPGMEARTTVAFHTFPDFAFAGVRCTHVERREPLILTPTGAAAGPGACDPLAGVALLFTAPVDAAALARALALDPPFPGQAGGRDPWEHVHQPAFLRGVHERGRTYPVWLPEHLPAHRGHRLHIDASLADAFGRPLPAAAGMNFGTAHRRPRLHLPHPVAVLEQGVDSEVPVYVTNLEALDLTWRTTRTPGARAGRRALPAVEDLAWAVPLDVRGMLAGRSGAVMGTVTAVPDSAEQDRHQFFAQVTPFAVTVKLGHFGSIAWVTRMDDGTPVEGASLTLYPDSYAAFDGPGTGTSGPFVTDASGIAHLPGSAVLDPTLELLEAWRREKPRLFLRVTHADELAVLPLDNEFRVWTRSVWPRRRRAYGHLKAWGTTAQGIYRTGDEVDYKLYLRHQDTRGLVPAPSDGYRLSVIDPKGEALVDGHPFTLNAFGAASGKVPIPEGAAVGWYRFQVRTRHGDQTLEAFRVLVSDFSPAPFKVSSTLNAERFEPGDRLRIDTLASLHAGGPYGGAQARVSVRVTPTRLRPEHALARRFHFDTGDADGPHTVYQDEAALDRRGERRVEIPLPDPGITYGRLEAESAVRDDRGKRVAARATAGFSARDRFVGLRTTRWLHTAGEPARVEYLVVDAAGVPVAHTGVKVAVQREEIFTARVKGAGNTYAARHERRWRDESSCSGDSSANGGVCEFVPGSPGRYRITAHIVDTRGREHSTSVYAWVQGAGQVTWAEPEDGALELVAEGSRLKVGDTARYLVRNPFPGALALVSVERYGVLRAWTERLEGSTPVIAFPVLPDDVPGFHLSVTVVASRIAAPPAQRGQVDLGKPTLRMGYVTVPVDDPVKRLDVAIRSDAPRYEPRDTAIVDLAVTARDGGEPPAEPVELAVAVLDEAVFDLIAGASRSFDPYAGFYALEAPDVVSYGLLTRLVGRQQFEKKGASAGGDGGGVAGLRDVSRFVSYWNPSLPVEAGGRARIQVPLPDNLTRWRVLALAVTPGDRMGLGEGGFSVNKDTELRPAMPNQVRPGDRFQAGFTLLNRTAAPRTLSVELAASGTALEAATAGTFTVEVAPFAREPVELALAAVRPGAIHITARAGDALDDDALAHTLEVMPSVGVEAAASHASLDRGTLEIPLAIPDDIQPGSGSLDVTASQTVIGNAEGAFRHMRDYPYACWEQRLSKAVMASRYTRLRDYLDADLQWPGSDTLPARTLAQAARFQAPGGGMSFWVAEDGRVSPYLSAYTAIAFDWLEADGHAPPQPVRTRLEDYLARMLRRDVMPDFYTRGMSASVRAVALAALARRGRLDATDALRYRDALVHMSVFAKAHYLEALWRTLGDHEAVTEARDALLAHASESAGKLSFSETAAGDEGKPLLETSARANCAALAALSTLAAAPATAEGLAPLLPKLVRSVSATRGRRDHWENTQENVFCMGALAGYAAAFEADTPDFTLHASLGGESMGEARFRSRQDRPVTLEYTLTPTDAGTQRLLRVRHEGSGRAYVATRLRYAVSGESAGRVDAGMSLRREYSVQRDGRWTLLRPPVTLTRGDLVRVDLYLSLPAARHFVVVDDPVPGALEPVNRDLATASTVDAEAGTFQAAGQSWFHSRDDWRGFGSSHFSFYHRELRDDAARFFSDYLPAGHYHLSYTAQAIATGRFTAPPTHAEEMYDPEISANGLPATLEVTGGAGQ